MNNCQKIFNIISEEDPVEELSKIQKEKIKEMIERRTVYLTRELKKEHDSRLQAEDQAQIAIRIAMTYRQTFDQMEKAILELREKHRTGKW